MYSEFCKSGSAKLRLCYFCKVCEAGKVWCNGRGEPLPYEKQKMLVAFFQNVKPNKRTQTLTLRKIGKAVLCLQADKPTNCSKANSLAEIAGFCDINSSL